MKIEVCKTCPHCITHPKTGAMLTNPQRLHYHCELASPKPTPHGLAFTVENPTNIIAEEYDERQRSKTNDGQIIAKRVVVVKTMFKIPAACPSKELH